MAIIARARDQNASPAEARLWLALRGLRAEGMHFRRQAPMRGFILDFANLDGQVTVEVARTSHWTERRIRAEKRRDAALAGAGWLTLRFDNHDVRDRLEGGVERIREACLARPSLRERLSVDKVEDRPHPVAMRPPSPEGEGNAQFLPSLQGRVAAKPPGGAVPESPDEPDPEAAR